MRGGGGHASSGEVNAGGQQLDPELVQDGTQIASSPNTSLMQAGSSSQPVGSPATPHRPEISESQPLLLESIPAGPGGSEGIGTPVAEQERQAECGGSVGKGARLCRICLEDDDDRGLDTPCGCSGSVKYAHRKCIQRWCNEKGNSMCEICHQPFEGYTAEPRPELVLPDGTTVMLTQEQWAAAATQLADPRLLTTASGRLALNLNDYNEYSAANSAGAAWCRSFTLILMALLLLRHSFEVIAQEVDSGNDPGVLALIFLRVLGFLLPCYILARALAALQHRRDLRQRQQEEQQDTSPLASSQVAVLWQPPQGGMGIQNAFPPPPRVGPDVA